MLQDSLRGSSNLFLSQVMASPAGMANEGDCKCSQSDCKALVDLVDLVTGCHRHGMAPV